MIEHSPKRRASTDDVVKLVLRAHLLLEVHRFWITCRLRVGWASKSVPRIQRTDGPPTPAPPPSRRGRGERGPAASGRTGGGGGGRGHPTLCGRGGRLTTHARR